MTTTPELTTIPLATATATNTAVTPNAFTDPSSTNQPASGPMWGFIGRRARPCSSLSLPMQPATQQLICCDLVILGSQPPTLSLFPNTGPWAQLTQRPPLSSALCARGSAASASSRA